MRRIKHLILGLHNEIHPKELSSSQVNFKDKVYNFFQGSSESLKEKLAFFWFQPIRSFQSALLSIISWLNNQSARSKLKSSHTAFKRVSKDNNGSLNYPPIRSFQRALLKLISWLTNQSERSKLNVHQNWVEIKIKTYF